MTFVIPLAVLALAFRSRRTLGDVLARCTQVARVVIATLSLAMTVLCALMAINENHPSQVGLAVVFGVFYLGLVVAYHAPPQNR